jgi:hypothetical protein
MMKYARTPVLELVLIINDVRARPASDTRFTELDVLRRASAMRPSLRAVMASCMISELFSTSS